MAYPKKTPAEPAAPQPPLTPVVAVIFGGLVIGAFIIIHSYFYNRSRQIESNVNKQLSVIADLKAEQIINWREERFVDGALLGATGRFGIRAQQHPDKFEWPGTDSLIIQLLNTVCSSGYYRSAALFSINKECIYRNSTGRAVFADSDEVTVFDSVVKNGVVAMTDLHSPTHDYHNIHMTMFAPVKDPGENRVRGVVMLEIDPEKILFPLIQSWPMPSRSAEVLIVRQDGDSVLFCNELRHKKYTALSMRLPRGLPYLPAAMAVKGFVGVTEGVDYRGKRVLATVRPIDGTHWYLIAKIDIDEAFSTLRQQSRELAIAMVAVLLLVLLSAALYQRHRSSELYKRLYRAESEKGVLTESLRQSEQLFRSLFEGMTEGVALHELQYDAQGIPVDYRVLEVNKSYQKHTGINPDITVGTLATKLYDVTPPPYLEEYAAVAASGKPFLFETFYPPMNKYFSISVCANGASRFATVFEDITERKNGEKERGIALELLQLLNSKNSLVDLMKAVSMFVQSWLKCEAVGIRLKKENDFPYYQTCGFPEEFVLQESSLCCIDHAGNIVTDESGNAVLACMCGNVIEGRFDPQQPFFTRKGSFWSNGTTELLASTTEKDRQARTRNRCNGEGYESVALIRLQFAGTPIGLIQVNDKQKNRFSLRNIEQLERFADSVAIALEQRKNQADLMLEKERLLVTLRSIGDGVITTDTEGHITLMNTVAEELTGYSSAESAGKPLGEVFTVICGEGRTQCENPVDKVLAGGGGVGLANNALLICSDGTERAIADSGAPIRDDQGEIIGVVLVFRDVTEKKRAEESLRASEERFRKVYEEGRFGIAIVNKTFGFEQVNRTFCSMLGYTEVELLRMSFKDITHSEFVGSDIEHVRAIIEGKIQVYKTDKKYLHKNGTVVWAAVVVTAVNNDAGEFCYFLAMIQDITDRKRAEENLVVEKERLAVTLRSIGDAMIATDLQGNIVLMNLVAEKLTGWQTEEANGKPLLSVFNIVNTYSREQCRNPVDTILAGGTIVGLGNDTVLLSKDGREIAVGDSGAPIRNQDGTITGTVLVFRDVTEKQKADAAVQKTEKLESLGILAAGIAHDFNNLLSGLFGYLDLARECVDHKSDAAQYIDKAFSVFGRTKDLTSQLLTFAKGGAPARKTKDLPPLINDTARFALSGSSVKCEFTMDNHLWQCDVDENQLAQVIDNLIINARDAMPRGGTISITAENLAEGAPLPATLAPGKYVCIKIGDEGTGINPTHLQYIFDPFFTTKQKGSGLGLAVSFSILQRHNGTLDVESELGKGTTFKLYLPASQGAATPEAEKKALMHRGKGAVIVMDDEDYIREIAGEMLSAMGYTVTLSSSGEEAVATMERLRTEGVNVLFALLDLTIPGGMGGVEAAVALKKIDSSVKLVASSGYAEDPVIARPGMFGFNGSIKKPYYKTQLESTLNRIFS